MVEKIAICLTNDLVYDQRLLKTCNALRKHFNFEILCLGVDRGREYSASDDAFEAFRFKMTFKKGPLFYLEYNLRLLIRLLRLRKEINKVLAFDADTLLASGVFSYITQIPLYYDAHEWFSEVPELQQKPIVRTIWDIIERFGVKRAKACYTVGPKLAEIFTSKHAKPFQYIRNTPFFNEPPPVQSRAKMILYQGALNEGRCLGLFLDFAKNLPEYNFVLAGDGDIAMELSERIQKEVLINVQMTGKLPPADLKILTQQATFGFNVLENKGKSYYYSLANKFFDYAAAGVISINSPFPEYEDLIQKYDHAFMVEPQIDAITNLIVGTGMEELRLKQQNGYKMMRDINWEVESEKLKLIFQ
ncbi:MAG: hypothetical protein KDC49_06180 [Saprospiraceae bacterium]|nr:hypothetical protein [Saprospiraceae bacterium]